MNFKLPADAEATGRVLSAVTSPGKPRVFVGCPVWTCKEWLGRIYPANAREKDYLYHYSRQFNTIELNTTHYRIPDVATVHKWCAAVNPDFRFCPKWPQQISHELALQGAQSATEAFCTALTYFGQHLGTSFLQLPPTFGPAQLPILEQFLINLPPNIPLAVELRHPDWFTEVAAFNEVCALLEACQVSTVITDVAGRRDVLHQRLTTTTAFIRFNGYRPDAIENARLEDWVAQLTVWLDQGLQTIYFMVHHADITHSPGFIRQFIQKLTTATGISLEPPHLIPQTVQGSLFE